MSVRGNFHLERKFNLTCTAGFGVTDIKGSKLPLFNQASRYLKNDTSACGSQKLNGKKQTFINFQQQVAKNIQAGLPTAAQDGTIGMTLFQVNADGAGLAVACHGVECSANYAFLRLVLITVRCRLMRLARNSPLSKQRHKFREPSQNQTPKTRRSSWP